AGHARGELRDDHFRDRRQVGRRRGVAVAGGAGFGQRVQRDGHAVACRATHLDHAGQGAAADGHGVAAGGGGGRRAGAGGALHLDFRVGERRTDRGGSGQLQGGRRRGGFAAASASTAGR